MAGTENTVSSTSTSERAFMGVGKAISKHICLRSTTTLNFHKIEEEERSKRPKIELPEELRSRSIIYGIRANGFTPSRDALPKIVKRAKDVRESEDAGEVNIKAL